MTEKGGSACSWEPPITPHTSERERERRGTTAPGYGQATTVALAESDRKGGGARGEGSERWCSIGASGDGGEPAIVSSRSHRDQGPTKEQRERARTGRSATGLRRRRIGGGEPATTTTIVTSLGSPIGQGIGSSNLESRWVFSPPKLIIFSKSIFSRMMLHAS